MIIQRQHWFEHNRYLIADEYGSVLLDLYDNPAHSGSCYGEAWIWGLYVCPCYRRKGHAKRLLEEAESYAAKEGHKEVYLQWEIKNTSREVLDFYKRNGYVEIDADTERREIMLRKELTDKINKI